MEILSGDTPRRIGIAALAGVGVGLAILHVSPAPLLRATTGAQMRYARTNFLSEFARTDYAPIITTCFLLLALGALCAAVTLRHLRREAALLTVAGFALALLAVLPTDLADLTTDAGTCQSPVRIEPCTITGRIHNPLSTFVFAPIVLTALSLCVRSRGEPRFRGVARCAVVCGILAACGLVASSLYLQFMGWHGRAWTGLMQRSLVCPTLLWMVFLLAAAKTSPLRQN